jgi:hypothetical protein
MNIGFHSNQLGMRGTEVALYDYAYYNETILGNKSFIISDKNNNLDTLEKFCSRFEVFLYDDFIEVETFAQSKDIDVMYYIKAGDNDGKILKSCTNAVHTVFQVNQPHGDSYLYISEWLAEKMTGDSSKYVPHIVTLPETLADYRDFLGIPKTSIVYGRHGGYRQFDYPWVHKAVYTFAQQHPEVYFIFMNTEPFCEALPNIIHIEPTYDLEQKTAFINTCDVMIHGRSDGESFGLAIAEFLHQDKPVITCREGHDQNHRVMLGEDGIYYSSFTELLEVFKKYKRTNLNGYYKNLVSKYSPEEVMKRFNQKFINKNGA